MKTNLIVVFGKPGAGKSYVAEILGKQFGYFVYDGDSDIPGNMKDALFQKENITDNMRQAFLANLVRSVTVLSKQHEKLAVNQAFIKHFMQREFLAAFPRAKFVLVVAADSVREKRYMKRGYFNLGLDYLRLMSALFEEPEIPYIIITNNSDGNKELTEQLNGFFKKGLL